MGSLLLLQIYYSVLGAIGNEYAPYIIYEPEAYSHFVHNELTDEYMSPLHEGSNKKYLMCARVLVLILHCFYQNLIL